MRLRLIQVLAAATLIASLPSATQAGGWLWGDSTNAGSDSSASNQPMPADGGKINDVAGAAGTVSESLAATTTTVGAALPPTPSPSTSTSTTTTFSNNPATTGTPSNGQYTCQPWSGQYLSQGTKIAISFDVTVKFALGSSIKYENFISSPVWLHIDSQIDLGVRGLIPVVSQYNPPMEAIFVISSVPSFDDTANQGYILTTLDGSVVGFSGPGAGAPDGFLHTGSNYVGSIEHLYFVRNGVAGDSSKRVSATSSHAYLARETTRIDFCEVRSYDSINQALACVKSRSSSGCTGSSNDAVSCKTSYVTVYVCS